MRQEGLLCTRRRCRKYRPYTGQVKKTAPNLLHRDFRSDKPMKKLVTDVTEFKVAGAKPYLSPVIDLHNDEIVAYSISRSSNMNMVQRMLAGLEGRLHTVAQQRPHKNALGRLRPGRVQTQPGRMIHLINRSGNGVLCSFGLQLIAKLFRIQKSSLSICVLLLQRARVHWER